MNGKKSIDYIILYFWFEKKDFHYHVKYLNNDNNNMYSKTHLRKELGSQKAKNEIIIS